MRASSVIVAAILMAAGTAHAEDPATFTILAPRADSASAERLPVAVESMRAGLAGRGIAAPDRDELRARRDAKLGDLSEGRALLAEAAQRFGAMDFAGSTGAYERASAILQSRFADLLGEPEAVTAAVGIARALLASGREIRARDEIRAALAVDPTLRLDPAEHPPELVQVFEEVRAELQTSVPPGPPPERLCTAAKELGGTHAATLELRKVGGRTELTVLVRDAVTCERTGTGVVQVRSDEPPAWEEAARLATAQAVAPPASTVVEGPPVAPPPGPTGPPPGPPWYTRWYVLAGAGAVAVGVATALLWPALQPDNVEHAGGTGGPAGGTGSN